MDTLSKSKFGSAKLIRFSILTFGVWLHAACSMLAATTLPTAIDDIGGANIIGWAFSLYQLGSILAGAATGLMVSRLGFRYALLAAGVVYIVGSLICGSANSMQLLVAGRLVQGIGGGWLVALTYVVINREYPKEIIPRLQAILSAVWTMSAFCGPLVGGTFSTMGLWRLAFWAFAIQGFVFILAVLFIFKEDRNNSFQNAPPLPVIRLGVLASSILLISFSGISFHPVYSSILFIASFAVFWLFLRLDHNREQSRMYPTRPFSFHHPIGICLTLVWTAAVSTMTFLVYGPYFLEKLYGLTPLSAGYILVLESIGWGAAAILFSGSKRDGLMIRTGVFVVTLGLVGLGFAMPNDLLPLVVIFALLQGAGFGMMWGFIIKNAVSSVPQSERDVTSSALPTTQQIAFAVGAALSGLVANALGFADAMDVETVRKIAFWVFIAFVPVALIANYAAWKFTRILQQELK